MEALTSYESYDISEEEVMKQLNSDLIKESEILDEEELIWQPPEFEEDIEGRPGFSNELHADEEINALKVKRNENNETKEPTKADVCESTLTATEGYSIKVEVQNTGSPVDRAANSLLRRTISELERALNDTNKLLLVRDTENSKVRAQLMLIEKKYEEELERRKALEFADEEKGQIITSLEERLKNEKKEVESLKLWIENNKDENTMNFVKETICATPEEIDKIREINIEQEKKILELKMRLRESEIAREKEKIKLEDSKQRLPSISSNDKTKCKNVQKEQNLQMKLRMKFMRDAFFYFMIDYHAEEQLRAILAILEYEDRRQDIIFEAHKMRQEGRKFSVSQVSSRKFTFVQEEHR
ncbi:putative autophagy-related protein 11 [Rhopilema esculentum]|uniref:putative autophagy-related protein 11 n=1 Tax=Rhopilema esculentum TaxID=499914 RepID=UPI0031E02818|eukprot:gene8346-14314_t